MSRHRVMIRAFARQGIPLILSTALLLPAETARSEEKEPFAVIELGATGEWGLPNGSSSFGPAAAVEFTPIENWLEVETGVSSLFRRHQSEWDTDLVFKKPFDFSPTVEIEPGIGPEWIHTIGSGRTNDALGMEAVVDIMFWPRPDHKFGWFLEPSYSYSFGKGHDQSLGASVGLTIGIP